MSRNVGGFPDGGGNPPGAVAGEARITVLPAARLLSSAPEARTRMTMKGRGEAP